jgi:hypothetical protein
MKRKALRSENRKAMKRQAMHSETALTRRGLLSGGGLLAVTSLVACQKREFSCWDTGQLPQSDVQARRAVEYVDRAPDPGRQCDACQHWQSGARADECGGCAVVRGQIHPLGTCRLFTKRA